MFSPVLEFCLFVETFLTNVLTQTLHGVTFDLEETQFILFCEGTLALTKHVVTATNDLQI